MDLASGEGIYKAACLACHGFDGRGGHGGGPTLLGKLDAEQIRAVTTTGRNNMPTFREIYDVNQLRDVSEYIVRGLGAQGEVARCWRNERVGIACSPVGASMRQAAGTRTSWPNATMPNTASGFDRSMSLFLT